MSLPIGMADVDLSDQDFWTRPIAERAAAFDRLRGLDQAPFFPEPDTGLVPTGPGFYAVTSLDDVTAASRRPDVFRSGAGATSIADMPPEILRFFGSMINMDDPEHLRLRRVVSHAFTSRRVAALFDSVRWAATEIVDDVIERGTCDVVSDIAAKLPFEIICDLMGVPGEQRRFFFERGNVILGASDPDYVADSADIVAELLAAAGELAAAVRELAEHRAARPREDLLTALVHAEVDGERLTRDEIASFFILLLVAGNETTRNAIAWGVHLLSEHPEAAAAWAADVDGPTATTAVEEIVRWSSPVMFMRRTVAEPVELAGRRLRPGEKVVLFYWAANRDPAHFADPHRFDIGRSPNPHVGFGAAGPHFCLGAHLARQEIRVMFAELLTRIPDLRASGEPRRLRSMFINGVKHLPATFTPGGAHT